jgi:hypothetical protein
VQLAPQDSIACAPYAYRNSRCSPSIASHAAGTTTTALCSTRSGCWTMRSQSTRLHSSCRFARRTGRREQRTHALAAAEQHIGVF